MTFTGVYKTFTGVSDHVMFPSRTYISSSLVIVLFQSKELRFLKRLCNEALVLSHRNVHTLYF